MSLVTQLRRISIQARAISSRPLQLMLERVEGPHAAFSMASITLILHRLSSHVHRHLLQDVPLRGTVRGIMWYGKCEDIDILVIHCNTR